MLLMKFVFCSSARGASGLMVERLTSIQKVLGSNPSWIPDFFFVDLFLTLSTKKHQS